MMYSFNLHSTCLWALLLMWVLTLQIASLAAGTQVLSVTFPARNLELEGTLRLPSDISSTVPGVILIHGSGAHTRDQVLFGQLNMLFGFEIAVFAEIGNALAERGIAVLTYDKRNCGSFNNCTNDNSYPFPPLNLTIDAFIDDALAAATFLQQQEQVESVIVIGHSQSGPFIPIMLEDRPDLAGGIMLAGNYHPVEEILEYQLNFTLDLYEQLGINNTVALARPEMNAIVELVNGVNSIVNGTYNETYFAGASTEFWKSLSQLSQRALDATEFGQPVLVFNGELDTNVPPSEALLWNDHFTNNNVSHKLEIVPCVTHALNCLSESDYTKITVDDFGTTVAPATIDAISNFIFDYVVESDGDTTSGVDKDCVYGALALIGLCLAVCMFS